MDSPQTVACPICSQMVSAERINAHLDNSCQPEVSSAMATKADSTGKSGSRKKAEPRLASIFTSGVSQNSPRSAQKRPQPDPVSYSEPTSSSGMSSRSVKRPKQAHFDSAKPFSEKMRPTSFSEFVGQPKVISLLESLENNPSFLFWGPPGCGKTTLSRLIAQKSGSIFKELSATSSGVNDVKSVFEEAKRVLALSGRRTVLFMDEIHRFSRSQQDVFLPYVEQGHIQLIGATTENPSFKLTAALLSRCRVLVLDPLSPEDIKQIIENALTRANGDQPPHLEDTPDEPSTSQSSMATIAMSQSSASKPPSTIISPDVMTAMTMLARGDARTALSLVELALSSSSSSNDDTELIEKMKRLVSLSFTTEDHYDMISALHKSIRGSQGSSALYWLARMLIAGEDPLFICRRLVVCASEDIGLADNHALPLAISTMHACERIGMPECRINLAHLVSYLSEARKSTRSYEGYKAAEEAAKATPSSPVPMGVRNAPTGLMSSLGYGEGYNYNPSFAHPVHNTYLPPTLADSIFLQTPEAYLASRTWDEDALKDWEHKANRGESWPGRLNQ